MKQLLLLAFFLGSHAALARGSIRDVLVKETDVVEIKTALGYSTLLQFNVRPTSVVLGDQDAFKVEYVQEGLTIKPLVHRVKTNLFVFTDYDKFNFRLTTVDPGSADYLVRVRKALPKQESVTISRGNGVATPVAETPVQKAAACDGYRFTVKGFSFPSSGAVVLIHFTIRKSTRDVLQFSPGDIELYQTGRIVPIEDLYLERLFFSRRFPELAGTMIVRRSNVAPGRPVTVGFSPDGLSSAKCLRINVSLNRNLTPQKK